MAYSREQLKQQLMNLGIDRKDTILVHSSMKAIGSVEKGAEGVLNAFIEYMKEGLLIFPTHTWDKVHKDDAIYNPDSSPSCVGVLSNLFMKRQGVHRSLHPTHSVAALGREAAQYVRYDDSTTTPCAREGCWGHLYDREAKILFVGCSLQTNTYIHGVEEWSKIPNRLRARSFTVKIQKADGSFSNRIMMGHDESRGDVSKNYDKIGEALLNTGIAINKKFGDADTWVCKAREMADLVSNFLQRDPDLFADKRTLPKHWYE